MSSSIAVLALLTGLLGILSRIAIGRVATAGGRVDHYYWMLAAQAYRTQRGLPVHLPGKYLMEDEAQSYPPLFGLLLGRCSLDEAGVAVVLALEVIQMCVLAAVMTAFHAQSAAIALGVALYAAAPVLVMYDTQLNSRIFGDIFLFGLFAAEACAAFTVDATTPRVILWGVAVILTALVIMTHKMTVQLYTVLLLPWSWALHSVMPIVVFLAGLGLYGAIVGSTFARYQFRTHWEFITFWNKHWRSLGAHQFRDSPVYGGHSGNGSTCFHQPGLRGMLRHLKVVLSYAPFNLVLPLASVATASWPPTWLLIWLGCIYLWAFATLLVPQLRCLGGGHLYVFNAVGPGACYVAWLPDTRATTIVLGAGVAMSAVSLFMAWRIVRARPAAHDDMFHQAVSVLARQPTGRVAVFPLQSAEAVAWATPHAVLWGAHGSGLSRLENFFPVLRQPLATFLREYQVRWVLSDDRYWPIGADMLNGEGLSAGSESRFGHWRITECRTS